jgi:hypothetical protein
MKHRELKILKMWGAGCALAIRYSLSAIPFCLSACVSIAQQDTPAIITNPTEESHGELVRVVSGALSSTPVTIARDALTRDSLLLIERTPARDAAGQRLTGRDLEKPEQFNLLKNGEQCVLVHEGTGKRSVLTKTRCTAR